MTRRSAATDPLPIDKFAGDQKRMIAEQKRARADQKRQIDEAVDEARAGPRGRYQRHHLDKYAGVLVEAHDSSEDDELLTTGECALWLRVSTQFLDIGRNRGYGPPFCRVGPHMVRYRRAEVIAWLKERTYSSTAEYETHGGRPKIAR